MIHYWVDFKRKNMGYILKILEKYYQIYIQKILENIKVIMGKLWENIKEILEKY